MVQTVSLPFGALNNIPGVSGIEDVSFDVPEVEDVVDPVVEEIADPADVAAEVGEELGTIVAEALPLDELAATIGEGLEDELDIQIPDEVELDITGSLFDTGEDLGQLFEEALERVDLDLPDPSEDLQNLTEDVQDVLDEVEALEVPETPDVGGAAQSAITSLWPDVSGTSFFDDPVGWAAGLIVQAADAALDDETSEDLRKLADRYSNETQ